ncbi:ArsR family transcriptional regulator [Haloarchaeobius amylolyticus]|uniref:ArsR family transcriptional regulator n=1 Tax=Haloarchaeobius amylolyticus TaxID=1198296 RepID=A0ABD6BBU7_9EURY
MLPIDDTETLLSAEDVVDAIDAIGDRDRLEVAYTVYDHPDEGVTAPEIAAELEVPEDEIDARIDALVDGGVVTERMACLVDCSIDGPQYELTEFGRLLFEEGVLSLFDAASAVSEL